MKKQLPPRRSRAAKSAEQTQNSSSEMIAVSSRAEQVDPTQVTVSVETITPFRARQLLSFNEGNRRISHARVQQYAHEMKRGNWHLTGDTIKISQDKLTGKIRLLDGQHRLEAIVLADVPVTTVVATGLSNAAFSVIDRGKTRTYGDILGMSSIASATTISSMARPIIVLDAGLNPFGGGLRLVTPNDVVDFYHKYADICQFAVNHASKYREMLAGYTNSWAMFLFMVGRAHGIQTAKAFVDSIASGVGLQSGDPRLALRTWLVRNTAHKSVAGRTAYEVAAILVRIYNKTVEGEQVNQIRAFNPSTEEWPKLSSKPFMG